MPSFPQLFSGVVSLYPVMQSSRRDVQVCEFTDLTEQRWQMGARLHEFRLTVESLGSADLATLVSFFDTVKGGKDVFDLTLSGTNYGNLVLISDTLEMTENEEGWSASIQCRQKRKT